MTETSNTDTDDLTIDTERLTDEMDDLTDSDLNRMRGEIAALDMSGFASGEMDNLTAEQVVRVFETFVVEDNEEDPGVRANAVIDAAPDSLAALRERAQMGDPDAQHALYQRLDDRASREAETIRANAAVDTDPADRLGGDRDRIHPEPEGGAYHSTSSATPAHTPVSSGAQEHAVNEQAEAEAIRANARLESLGPNAQAAAARERREAASRLSGRRDTPDEQHTTEQRREERRDGTDAGD